MESTIPLSSLHSPRNPTVTITDQSGTHLKPSQGLTPIKSTKHSKHNDSASLIDK